MLKEEEISLNSIKRTLSNTPTKNSYHEENIKFSCLFKSFMSTNDLTYSAKEEEGSLLVLRDIGEANQAKRLFHTQPSIAL